MLAEITRNRFTRLAMWYDTRGAELTRKEEGQMYDFSAGLFLFRYQCI